MSILSPFPNPTPARDSEKGLPVSVSCLLLEKPHGLVRRHSFGGELDGDSGPRLYVHPAHPCSKPHSLCALLLSPFAPQRDKGDKRRHKGPKRRHSRGRESRHEGSSSETEGARERDEKQTQKGTKRDKKGQKGTKRDKRGQKGTKRDKKGQKGTKRDKKGQKGTKRDKKGQKGTKSDTGDAAAGARKL
ncbi:hypothetical protein eimer-3490e09.tmp1 [Eimeria tenella]|uniref:Uncharacterized protein n=1 Tax=Eimeria tenella TaxID=5802 RepID=C8TDZ9_EIMTE|nr:hypothetical protein eimer-3490e09.tmp1 [Eimeria tenella]